MRDGLCGLRVEAGPVYEAANSAVVVLPDLGHVNEVVAGEEEGLQTNRETTRQRGGGG